MINFRGDTDAAPTLVIQEYKDGTQQAEKFL